MIDVKNIEVGDEIQSENVFGDPGEYFKVVYTNDQKNEFVVNVEDEGLFVIVDKEIQAVRKQNKTPKPNTHNPFGLKKQYETQGKHYESLKIDPYTYSYENQLNCLQFQVIKYVTRYNLKNGLQDLEKAKNTLEKLIEKVKK